MPRTSLQSKLRVARGLGSAKSGVGHWWAQRLTAIALAPLCIWFAGSILAAARADDPFRIADWLGSPVAALAMITFLVALFWHAKLGMQVVIEDYVHSPRAKYTLLIANAFLCFGVTAAGVLAVLRLHMFDLVAGGA